MARTQRKLIEKLDAFTNSLSDIVEILKEEVKEKKSDVTEQLTSSLSDNIVQIAEELHKVSENVSQIKKDTTDIKSALDGMKTQKEKGMLGEVGDKKVVKDIKKGVGIIVLIAGAVLAIGMAFKMVGSVDLASVITLSLAMIAVAKAVEIIANIEKLDMKKAAIAAGTMVIMAGAITLSSYVLKYIEPLTGGQLLTTALLAGTLGAVAYLTFKALNKIKIKPSSLLLIPLLPAMLPLISLGIVLSSKILTNVEPISLTALLGIVLLAAATAAMMYAVKPILSMKIEPKDIAKLALMPIIIPLVAGGIVLSSIIFQQYQPLGLNLALTILAEGLAMGLAIATFALSVYVLGKLDIKSLAVGAAGMVFVAGAIVGVSWLMQTFNENAKAPDIGWTLKTGSALIMFSLPVMMLGLLIMASGIGLGIAAIGFGAIGSVLVAGAMVAISHIVNKGKYDKYPEMDWVRGVGLSVASFGAMMMLFGIPPVPLLIAMGMGSVILIGKAIQKISKELIKGDYSNYPSLKWSLGVTSSLIPFASFMTIFGALMLASPFGLGKKILNEGINALEIISKGMVKVSWLLKAGSWVDGEYPSPEWAGGVGQGIALFAKTLIGLKLLKETPEGFVDFIKLLAKGLVEASHNLEGGNWTSGHPTKEWAEAVGIGISAFSYPIVELAKSGRKMMKMIAKDPEGFKTFIVSYIKSISHGLVEASKILGDGKWDAKVPTKEWAEGTARAIDAFTNPIIKLAESGKRMQKIMKRGNFTDFIVDFIGGISRGLVEASNILSNGDWSSKTPSEDWVKGLSNAINALSLPEKQIESIGDVISMLKKFDDLPINRINDNLNKLSKSFLLLGFSIKKFGINAEGNINALKDTASGIMLFSIIDHEQLKKTLNILEQRTTTLKKVSDETPQIMEHLESLLDAANNINVYTTVEGKEGENEAISEIVKHVSNIDKNIEEMLNLQKDNFSKVNERYEKEMESAKNVNESEDF